MWRLWGWQAWVVAGLWTWRGMGAVFGLPKVPDLLRTDYDAAPADGPTLTVVVPALNEEKNVGACLESLLGQEYESLEIVAVDDRSTDGTGAVMDRLAAALPDSDKRRLRVIHVKELPEGWLGKTHAMGLAARSTASEYILFTDADVIYRPDALRRSMAFAVESGADHLVTVPTLDLRRWDEAALLGFFQICGMWAARPWKVADAKAKRDAVGIGAFNLLRRAAYEQVGGFEALKMAVVEDLSLGRRIKNAGMAQRVAFGRGLVTVHWASGAMGLVGVLTKNMFSAFHFRIALLLGACGWLVGFCVLPWVGLGFAAVRVPAAITLLAMGMVYRAIGRTSGISAWYVLLSPVAALLMVYALLRSMATTLRQGGIVWRGTFYSLKELRENAVRLW
jgi:GT2 family glycosyltransferase